MYNFLFLECADLPALYGDNYTPDVAHYWLKSANRDFKLIMDRYDSHGALLV